MQQSWLQSFINHPAGPKTLHFWAPVFNWGFVIQGLYDWRRPPEKISRDMQSILTVYSAMFMRFSLRVTPKNYLLFAMHFCNFSVQGRLLLIRLQYERDMKKLSEKTE